MPQNFIFPDNPDPTSSFSSWWGGVYRAIIGRNTGKFKANPQSFFQVLQKVLLMDTSPGSLMKVAMQVPHLNTVISTGAELFSLMQIKHFKKNGTEITDSPLLQFLKHPNPLQSLEQYLYEYYVLNGVYNKTFQYKINGLNFEKIPDALWLLPSGWMKINTTGKIYRQTNISDIIENYEMYNDPIKFEVDRVIYMAEGVGNNVLNPTSRIEALQIPLSNIMAALKSNNIIISERGMIGFIARDSNNGGSDPQPPDKDELIRMRREYQNQYHLDSEGGHVSFTTENMKWVPMAFDVKQLGLNETTEDAFSAIIASFRHDRDIYPSTKGATYENKQAGLKSTITNGLQPQADKLMRQWSRNFTDEGSGEYLQASYSHLPAMKEDERLAAQGKLYLVQAGEILSNHGIIDSQGFADFVEIELSGDGVMKNTAPSIHINPPPANG